MNGADGGRLPLSVAWCALVLLAAPPCATLAAQVPPPPPRDTLPVRRDTAGADTLQVQEPADTALVPAALFPFMPRRTDVAAALTEWVWDRETLLREAPVSLVDLLERIPGITTLRAGTFVQPEAASVFGSTAGRTEIELDGYILDPLIAPTLDLSQIPLGQLREVRVQRRLGLLRIILTTEYPEEGRPYTRVEAGIGLPSANMFRGLFLVPHVIVGPLALGIERVDTDGIGRAEPAGLFSGWAKWAWTGEKRGIQLELLRGSLKREPNSPWLADRSRQDIVLRARNQFAPNFVAEAYAGRGKTDGTIPPADETGTATEVERTSIQAGVRGALELTWATFDASVRYRSLNHLPVTEGHVETSLFLGPLRVGGALGASAWEGSFSTTHASLHGEIGQLYGLSAFGELTLGQRGAPVFDDTIGDGVLFTDRSGWRGGLSLDLGRASGTIALVSLDQDFAVPFGLPFDTVGRPAPVGPARGLEARGRVVIWPDYLTLSSWITDWRESDGWTYLPSRSWRTALELHALPLPSGNLEIFGRAEAHMRGSVLVHDPALTGTGFLTLPSFTTADAYLQIRIIDVRMFIRWEDVLSADIEELPGRVYRGPRIFYGVKWNLWN